MAAVMHRCSICSSIVGCWKEKTGSEAGRGDGVLILRRYSLGVSFLVGSDRNAEGFGEEEDCDLVTRVLSSEVAVVAAAADAVVEPVAASSANSSSPQGHM